VRASALLRRSAPRFVECFDGAVALSGPLTDHRLGPADAPDSPRPARFFLYASHEEASTMLDDGISLLDAAARTGDELSGRGHAVRCAYGDGGHTYAAWQAILPEAIAWALSARRRASLPARPSGLEG
jgi:hypothetical protein